MFWKPMGGFYEEFVKEYKGIQMRKMSGRKRSLHNCSTPFSLTFRWKYFQFILFHCPSSLLWERILPSLTYRWVWKVNLYVFTKPCLSLVEILTIFRLVLGLLFSFRSSLFSFFLYDLPCHVLPGKCFYPFLF